MNEISTSPKSGILKDILITHCQNEFDKKGLLLLTLPTGFGKTFYVLQYIAHHLKEGFTQKVWFITNLKKNLPVDDLKKLVGTELFEKYVVFLDNYAQQVQDFFESGNEVPKDIRDEMSSYIPLVKAIESLKRAPENQEFKDFLQKDLSKKERVFRTELKFFLRNYFPTKSDNEQRLDILRSTPELRWVAKMYPSVLYFEKKVFFCSVDKFYRYVDTIIGPNIQITTPAYIKDSIVFIDEFDATKANIKNAIIENAIKFNQDIVKLFTRVYYGLLGRPFPQHRIGKTGNKSIEYLESKFEDIRQVGRELYEKFNFQSYYYFPKNEPTDRAFLFHDNEYHTVFETKKGGSPFGYLLRNFSEKEKTNFIEISKNRPTTEDENLLVTINQIRAFIHLFSFFVSDFAKVYKEAHDNENTEEISIENAIKTSLDLFDVNDAKTQAYFIDHIFHHVYVAKNSVSTNFDLSPINKGFRFYNLVNRKRHDATTHILYADTLTTPETWLVNLCQHANIIGISATAGFDSPISNYSLSHLRHHLGHRFYELSKRNKELLKQEFYQKNIYSDRREIRLESIEVESNKRRSLESIFSEKEIQNHFLTAFADLESFEVQRYIKTAKAYLYFLQNDDIKSFLCLLNKFPKKGNNTFNESILKELFVELRIENLEESEEDAKAKVKSEVKILRSQKFEEDLSKINSQLLDSKKVFVLSTYQTIGAGQNIQYFPPEDIPVVEVNDLKYGGGKKDYDAVYLEKPTNLLNYFMDGNEIGDKELLDYLFEVEYLTEGGAINLKEKQERIKYAFHRRHRKRGVSPSNQHLFQRKVVSLHFCRVLLQAIGRLSRTRLKSPITHIVFDQKIQDYLKHFQAGDFLLVKEFEAFYNHCISETTSVQTDNIEVQNLNIYQSLNFASLVRKLVRNIPNWKKDTIEFWTKLRLFVLRHPTISYEKLVQSGLQKYYIKSPTRELTNRYFFHSNDDFLHDLEIDFKHAIGKEVSAEGAKLPQLLEIEMINNLFFNEENKFATTFQLDEYILSPSLFQNIYLGALGEEIGRCILENYGITLLDLEENEYELFDFKTQNGVYIDFKYWSPRTIVDASEQKEKIRNKMELAQVEKVIIINIIRPQEEFEPIIGGDKIIEIPGILCLEQKKIISESIQLINQIISDHA